MVYEDLCFPQQKHTTKEEVIEYISPILLSKGFVTQEFKDALIKREQEYPTGFDLGYIGVAIPHVDSQYVDKDGIWIMTFENTCEWNNVEDNSSLNVSVIFGLLFSEPHKHLEMLQALTGLFGQEELMNKIAKSNKNNELKNIIKDIL